MPQHTVPRHLSAPGQAWLRHLNADYEWTVTEWSLAILAAETRDRTSTARRLLTREGLTLSTPIMSKAGETVGERVTAHPAASIARDNAALFSKLIGQLGLDAESSKP